MNSEQIKTMLLSTGGPVTDCALEFTFRRAYEAIGQAKLDVVPEHLFSLLLEIYKFRGLPVPDFPERTRVVHYQSNSLTACGLRTDNLVISQIETQISCSNCLISLESKDSYGC